MNTRKVAPYVMLLLSAAAAACGDGPIETHVEENWLVLQFTGTEADSISFTGMPVYPDQHLHEHVNLAMYSDAGITHQVVAWRTSSSYGGSDGVGILINPMISSPGVYGPGDCNANSEMPDCVQTYVALGLPYGSGFPARSLPSVRDSVTLEIEHIAADTIRGSISGPFLLSSPGGQERVHASMRFFAVRVPSP